MIGRVSMKVGDLIGIGWSGIRKKPFVAVIKRVHRSIPDNFISGYTIFIPATGLDTFITPRDVKVLDESR